MGTSDTKVRLNLPKDRILRSGCMIEMFEKAGFDLAVHMSILSEKSKKTFLETQFVEGYRIFMRFKANLSSVKTDIMVS